MAKADFYESLGVSRDADGTTLKKSYRKLAMQYHPDRNPDDATSEAKFKEINEAYEVLSDPDKRAAYDQYGHAAFQGGAGGAQQGGFSGGGFADIFEEMFNMAGGGKRKKGGGRGPDKRFNVQLSLDDAFQGKTINIKVPSLKACTKCNGSGAEDPKDISRCRTCNGAGKVRISQGFFTLEQTCPHCRGQGQTINRPCRTCNGQAVIEENQALSIKIPAGISDGNRIRVGEKGDTAPGVTQPGDLYIFVSILPHEIFERNGDDLLCSIPVSVVSATLGGEIEVPTIDGKLARIKIAEGTQSGQRFRLKGKGMKKLNDSQRGNMFVEAQIEIPVNLNQKQRDLLHEFEIEGQQQKQNPASSHFFSKVRDLWDNIAS